MNNHNVKSKKLINKKLAYEVQEIAAPYVNQGDMSLISIYLNHVVRKVPIGINTFRKMMKEDVSDFPELAKAYQEESQVRYLESLHRQSRKRSKG